MDRKLVIGELCSLGTAPFFFPLKHVFAEDSWSFVQGTAEELDKKLEQGKVDVALASPLAVVNSPRDFLILPELGYAGKRHVRDMLLFSDMLLDDVDEMTVSLQEGSPVVTGITRIVLERYLGYQNNFIQGWGNAEAFVLHGDAALRERVLARYAYVYDVGDLWRHYTRNSMIYYLWIVRRGALISKENMVVLFQRLLKQALEVARSDWGRLSTLVQGYQWLKKPMVLQLWNKVEYELRQDHFEGLAKFYEECADLGLIEDVPELSFFEPE